MGGNGIKYETLNKRWAQSTRKKVRMDEFRIVSWKSQVDSHIFPSEVRCESRGLKSVEFSH